MLTLAQIHGQPEIFHSIQGEGVSQGTPCVFLRLAGCNLACSWCDTAYSWNGTVPGMRLAPEKAAELVLHYPCRRLVLTGGEPLIQQKALPALLPHLLFETRARKLLDGLPAAEPSGIYALRLASDPSSRTRLLLEFLKQRFGPIPPWDLALQRGLKRS